MTLIRFNFEKPSASGEDVPNEGSLRLVPTMRRVVEGDPDVVILPAPFSVKVSGSLGLELAATGPGWVWDLRASGFGVSSWQEFLVVPEPVPDPERPGEFLPVDYPDLVRVDPATLEPSAEPDPAWWAALEAAKATAVDVEAARVASAGSAVEAGVARDDAVAAAGEASGFAGDAAGAASAAVAAAGMARTDADTATAQAGEAGLALTGAESARDATVAAAGGSEASAAVAATAAVESAQSAADAEAAALDVVTRANSGEFKGDQGLPGNATMRVDTTVGTRVFITDGVTERMISGDTGIRDLGPVLADVTGSFKLSRTGNRVTLSGAVTATTSGTKFLSTAIPTGFRPAASPEIPLYRTTVLTPNGKIRALSSGFLAWYGPDQIGVETVFEMSWLTTQPWPTALPGNPN